MRSDRSLLRFLAAGLFAALATLAQGYDLIRDGQTGKLITWNSGSIPVVIRMAQTPTLHDGTSYATSVQAAMQTWNAQLANIQFAPTIAEPGTAADNGINEIVFASQIYGDAQTPPEDFGPNVLAVTLSYRSLSPRGDGTFQRLESDIVFNSGVSGGWSSYRFSLRSAMDIRRVALHELGHMIGLDHPDEAGQFVTAIMNSTVSYVDSLQADDTTGAQFQYGRPGGFTEPANNHFANATPITLSGNTRSVNGTSTGATKEPGEPNHAPDEPGGASVWWKWTATANGSLTVTTGSSHFDTLLAAYTGSSVGSLTQLAANDDVTRGVVRTSTVTIDVTSGTTYYFAVDGWEGEWGYITLNLSLLSAPIITQQPQNADIIAGNGTSFTVTATGAGPMTYRWQIYNGSQGGWVDLQDEPSRYSGSGSNTLWVTTQVSDLHLSGAQYRCVVTNGQGTAFSNTATLTVNPANRAPLAQLALSGERALGQTLTLTLTLSDPDGNFAYANLFVQSPGRGGLAIRADNTVVEATTISAGIAVASTVGNHSRTFTFTAADGPGDYSFRVVAVDAAGLQFTSPTQTISVGAAAEASFTLPGAQLDLAVPAGWNHLPVRLPVARSSGTPATGFTASSDVAWVTPTFDSATSELVLSFATTGLVTATNDATLRLMRGGEVVTLVVRANVAQPNLIALADDPARSRVYGLHQAGTGYGALVIHDPVAANPIGAITVGRQPGAMDIRPDGSELVVLCATSKTIAAVDLESLGVTATYSIASAYENTRPTATTGRLHYGAGNILYYVDGAWAPTLRVFDREARVVRQALLLRGGAPANTGEFGFGDFVVSPDGSALYGWGQYGWDAGSASSTVARLRILSDGRLEFDHANSTLGYPTFNRDPLDTPALMSADGGQLFIKQHLFDPANLNLLKLTLPGPVYSISRNGEIAATTSAIHDSRTGTKLYDIGSGRNVQTITSDYARLVYFDAASRTLKTIDLLQQLGTSAMGLADAPAQDGVVLPPSELRWIPQTGIDRYRVYLGLSQAAVAAAAPGGAEDLGEVLGPRLPLTAPLAPGATYYWRVDRVSGSQISVGPIQRFHVTPLGFSIPGINAATVRGHARQAASVQLTSRAGTEQAWTATTTAPWIKLGANSGTTPATLSVVLDASVLSAGVHRGSVAITTAQGTVHLPVELQVDALAITRMKAAPETTKVYAISEESATTAGTATRAYLLEIDTLMQRIERVAQVNSGVSDLAVHMADGRIYVTNWAAKKLLAVDLATFGVVRTYDEPAISNFYSTDFYRVAAGGAGRLLIEPKDQWVQIYLMDTDTGAKLASAFVREGGGAFDRAGRYYFHGENNSSGAALLKFDAAGDQLSQVARSEVKVINGHGSRNVVLSESGNRVFWNGGVYSASDLTLEWSTLSEVVASSADGRYIMTGNGVYDVTLRTQVSSLPVTVTAAAFNSQVGCFVFQNGAGLSFISRPGADTPGSSRTPAAGSVVAPLDTLQWTPLPGAGGYRVYLGTSSSAVAAADTASPLFVGEVTAPSLVLPSALAVGSTYYWRVDILVAGEIATGAVQSFTVSRIAPSLTEINSATVQGHGDQAVYVDLTAAAAGTAWSVTTDAPTWVKFDRASGVTPASLRVSLDATALPVGTSQGNITLTSGASTVVIPVRLLVDPLALVAIKADPDSARAYAISESSPGASSRAYLLELDCAAQRITRVVPAGSSATNLAWHPGDNRIYVTNWRAGSLIGFNPDSLARERTFAFPPFSGIGYSQRDAYHVAAGPPGRVMVEGYDQWIDLTLFDTVAGQPVGSYFARQGGGAYGASRRYYYHGESNSSGAVLQKIDTAGDTLRQLAAIRVTSYSYYGSRAVVVSADGTRIFWNGSVFDENLTELWAFGAEAYAATPDGRYVFGSSRVFDTVARQAAYLMPVTTSVSAFSGFTGKLIVQKGTAVAFYSLADLALASPPVIQSQPTSRTTYIGGRAAFSVAVNGGAEVAYRWQRQPAGSSIWFDIASSGGNYAGATTANLEVVNASGLNNGEKFRCNVSNVIGSVISDEATLTVLATAGPVQIAQGYNHAAVLRLDGTVLATGRNQEGQLGDGSGAGRTSLAASSITGVIALASGADHLLYLKQDGSLWASGYNEFGTLGTGDTANVGVPVQVATQVAAAAGGYRHTLVRKSDGTLWAAGRNQSGQLGLGDTTQRNSLAQVATHVLSASAGNTHSLYVTTDHKAYAMGGNASGQLGDGTRTGRLSPVLIGQGYVAVAAGYNHSLFLGADGTLWASGSNSHGQLGDGTTTDRLAPVQVATSVVAMAAGFYHTVFLKADGTAWAAGRNASGELGDGTFANRSTPVQIATGVAEINAGLHTTSLIMKDGTLRVTGLNDQGQLADGTTTNRGSFQFMADGGAGLPGPIATLTASKSSSSDRVTLLWTHASSVSHYRVLRGLTNSVSDATTIADRVVGNYYQDLTGQPGVLYRYWVQAHNAYGISGAGATDTGLQGVAAAPPTIDTPPQGQTVTVGTVVSLSVVASGPGPLGYQWHRNGNPIAGATAATLQLGNASLASAGDYTVVVSNPTGSVTSPVATLTVNRRPQTIAFDPLPDRTYTTAPLTLAATATSGLPVAFTLVSGPAILQGPQLTLTGPGTVVLRTTQPGDDTHDPAPQVERSFNVGKAAASVSLASLSATYDGAAKSATATTAPADLPVILTYDGTATAPTYAGSYTVSAIINHALYEGSASGTLVIAPAAQTITFAPLANRAFSFDPVPLSATSSSGLSVNFTLVAGAGRIEGTNLLLDAPGAFTLRATQPGNGNYTAAPAVEQSFTAQASLDSWALEHFSAEELLNPALSGPNADPDGDGYANLLEYALGLDPRAAGGELPALSVGPGELIYTYRRPAARSELTYTVQYSTNLTTWTASGVTHELVTSANGVETWRATVPSSAGPNLFLRLRVTR